MFKKIFMMTTLALASITIIASPVTLYANTSAKNIKINGVLLPQSQPIAPFKLMDDNGQAFTQKNLQGKWTFMFFGFTNCGMVCPTTMTVMNKMVLALDKELPADQRPNVVFVTVDPERDTTEKLHKYVKTFNPAFIGLRGSAAETKEVIKQFHIAAIKMETEGKSKNQYSINHTSEILLINPQGRLQAYLSYPPKKEQLIEDYKNIMAAQS